MRKNGLKYFIVPLKQVFLRRRKMAPHQVQRDK